VIEKIKNSWEKKMSRYNWIDGKDFSIDHFFLMDRWLLKMIFKKYETIEVSELKDLSRAMGTLLKENPKLCWYITKRAPETKKGIARLIEGAYTNLSKEELRKKEIELMEAMETDVIYTEPHMMQLNCNYIYAWDEKYLNELIDLKDMVVLDLGAGTGRLTFAAAKYAKRVYASEPVDMLREYMRDYIKDHHITNVKVLDGFVESIPYEGNTFDAVISGHVVGDNYEQEIQEMTRVIKNSGYIVICNGDDDIVRTKPDQELLNRGFEVFKHKSSVGGVIYNYRKQVIK
jgi:2-polyprenyl-3-methyl-5-hydroxy-6-metoxy-1,4-benzoquinol methylase